MRSISTLATLLLGLALSFSPAKAKELFDKPIDLTLNLFGLTSISDGPGGLNFQQIADEFYLSHTSVITRVVWTLPIRLSPTPTICSESPWTAGKGRRRRIEEAIRLIPDCSENRTGVYFTSRT